MKRPTGFFSRAAWMSIPHSTAKRGLAGWDRPTRIWTGFRWRVLRRSWLVQKPVLAICRGIQLINVALGGSLFQDIPSQFSAPALKHMQDTLSFDVDHPVIIAPGSRLFDLFGPRIMVNSRHHQSIKALGQGSDHYGQGAGRGDRGGPAQNPAHGSGAMAPGAYAAEKR